MPQVSTILTSYDKREGTGQRGAWVLHLYKDAGGTTYQTFEAPISNRAYGLLNKPVVLTYEEKASRKTDAQGNPYPPNKEIKGVELDTSVATIPATMLPSQAPTVAPVASQAGSVAPSATPPTLIPTGNSGGDDRQVQIMRQSALERAIRWIGVTWSLVGDVADDGSLYKLSEQFLHYFQTGEYPGKSETEFLAEIGNQFPDAAPGPKASAGSMRPWTRG